MKGLEPVYCTDKDFKTPLRDSTGVALNDLKNYAIEPGEVDNSYVNTNANGFRLSYVKEWEYATRSFQQKQENPSLEEECIFQVENFQII